MATKETVKLDVLADVKKAIRDLEKVETKLDGISDGVDKQDTKVSSLSSSWGKMGAIAGAAIGTVLVAGIGQAIKAASDLEEVSSKFQVVFADNFDAASQSVDELTQSYAMSTREAKSYLASVQDLLVPMGLASDKAFEMSDGIVKLSADLGSFNNLPTEQVVNDITSALTGSSETMKKYGVVLNETTIRQEAQNLGLKVGKGVLDATVRSQAAYSLILKSTTAAQGDMIRTSDSFANTMKKVGAAIEDSAAGIGAEMLPAFRNLAKAFLNLIKPGSIFGNLLKNIGSALGVLVNALSEAVRNINIYATAFQQVFGKSATKDYEEIQRVTDKTFSKFRMFGEKNIDVLQRMKAAGLANTRTFRGLKIQFEASADAQNNATNEMTNYADSLTDLSKYQNQFGQLEKQNASLVRQASAEMGNQIAARGGKFKNLNEQRKQLLKDLRQFEKEEQEVALEEQLAKEQAEFDRLVARALQLKMKTEEIEKIHQQNILKIKQDSIKKQQEQRVKDFQNQLASANKFVSQFSSIVSQLQAINNQYYTNQGLRYSQDYNKRKEWIENNVEDEAERKRQLEELDKKYDKKQKQLARRQAITAKAFAITQAIINTAQAYTKALASAPPPGNIGLANLMLALGATQIGLIASQPLPQAEKGGIIPGSAAGTALIAGERNKTEAIIPLEDEDAQEQLGGMGTTINFNGCFFATEDWPEQAATKIDEELFKLKVNEKSRLFSS